MKNKRKKKKKNYKLKKFLFEVYIKWKFLKKYIKMEKAIIKFGDTEIKKQKLHRHKRPVSIKNIDN